MSLHLHRIRARLLRDGWPPLVADARMALLERMGAR